MTYLKLDTRSSFEGLLNSYNLVFQIAYFANYSYISFGFLLEFVIFLHENAYTVDSAWYRITVRPIFATAVVISSLYPKSLEALCFSVL